MSANLISLGAVDFGIIIDSAVVLVEALMVRLALGELDGTAATRLTAGACNPEADRDRIGTPIMFSKLIIILAFVPIFTFQRVEGKIFSPMAFTLTFALLGAILLTLTLVPTLLCYAVKNGDLAEKHSVDGIDQERYTALLMVAAAPAHGRAAVGARARSRCCWRRGSAANSCPSSTRATSG